MKKRHYLDFYETQAKLTEVLLGHLPIRFRYLPDSIFECCNGNGAISKILAQKFGTDRLYTNDIDPEKPSNFHWDMAKPEGWEFLKNHPLSFDWVISNPPFSVAPLIIPHAYNCAYKGVAMLLRLSYLEPCQDRADWLKQHPPTKLIIFSPRPRFRPDTKGSDSVTVGWFIWEKDTDLFNTDIVFCNDWKK